jgi:hypothetical protein
MAEPRVIADFEEARRTSWGKQTLVLNPDPGRAPLAVRSLHIV